MTSKTSATDQAILMNLQMIADMLKDAHVQAEEALGYMSEGNRNAAIGTILGLDQALADARAIQNAAVALHRHAFGMPSA